MRLGCYRACAQLGLVTMVISACSDGSKPSAADHTGGGEAGDSTHVAGRGGSTSSGAGGGTSEAGASGAGEPTCESEASELTIDGSYWMWGQCNAAEIQGAWYCYADGISESDCAGKPRYTDGGYCLSGATVEDASGEAWGAAVAFELNHAVDSGKTSYDAEAHGVTGFALEVVGSSGGAPLRVGFKGQSSSGVVPFVEFNALRNGTSTLRAFIDEAAVPEDWEVTNAGETVDPRAISDVELRVAGGATDAEYSVCVVGVTPLFD